MVRQEQTIYVRPITSRETVPSKVSERHEAIARARLMRAQVVKFFETDLSYGRSVRRLFQIPLRILPAGVIQP